MLFVLAGGEGAEGADWGYYSKNVAEDESKWFALSVDYIFYYLKDEPKEPQLKELETKVTQA